MCTVCDIRLSDILVFPFSLTTTALESSSSEIRELLFRNWETFEVTYHIIGKKNDKKNQ
jgi:hypothetical protein